MRIRSTSQPPSEVKADWLILGIFDGQTDPPASIRETSLAERVRRLMETKDLAGSMGEATPLLGGSYLAAESVMFVGLGPRATFDARSAFLSSVAASKALASKPRGTVALVLPEVDDPAAFAAVMVQGVLVGNRGPGLRKSESSRHGFDELIVVGPGGSALDLFIDKGKMIGEAVNLARDLANTPPAEKSPTRLAARAREVGEEAGLTVDVWDESRLRRERFGGLLGVAAGSEEPPAFVRLKYEQGGGAPSLALVGKGVTFDSGGLSLKPSASMEDMKCDMTGAAVVLAAMSAVARLKLKVNLVGYLPLAENMTGGRAMKLGDVLTMRNGKTVEVMNTDAEGRLILADALSFAAEHKPARILDLATLTGACIVALGPQIAGLFSNDDAFSGEVQSAASRAGEKVWRLPLEADYQAMLKSQVADLKNVGGKHGGAITAARFLEQFVEGIPWVHLDIAGPAWSETESAIRDVGATGCFVRTLVALAERAETGSSEI